MADGERTIAVDQTGVFLGMKTCAEALNRARLGRQHQFDLRHLRRLRHLARLPRRQGAVRTLTTNVALHWASEGVRVNSIHPGFIRTPILDQAQRTEIWDALTVAERSDDR